MKTQLFIVDDHSILLDGIKSILDKTDNYEVCGMATSAETALQLIPELRPNLLLTDLNLPGMSGIELIKNIKKILPNLPVLVLSLHDEAHYIKEVLQVGVQGYILKNETSRDLLLAIEFALQGRIFMSTRIHEVLSENLEKPDQGKLLTDREKEILRLLAEEHSNKEIGMLLHISERTVETHRKNIFRKAGTNNMVGLMKFAIANHLID